MEASRRLPASGSPEKNLESVLKLLKHHIGEDAWLVAKAFQVCASDKAVAELAGYYAGQLLNWLSDGLAIPPEKVAEFLRGYTGPPSDPLLDELRRLIHNLDIANKRSGKAYEEDKGSAHIGVKGYEGSAAESVEQRIGQATLELKTFLEKHDGHFPVRVKDLSLLTYLNAVLSNQDVNTCNNEVANAMTLALDKQFAQIPPHIQVGLRLLKVGFFDTEQDLTVPDELDESQAAAYAKTIKSSVAAFRGGDFSTLAAFLKACEHRDELMNEGFLKGVGIKKALNDLVKVAQTLAEEPDDNVLQMALQSEAERVKFL